MANLSDFRRGLKQFEREMVQAMARATRAASAVLVEEMEGLSSAIDHSLEDLRALGHPYSTQESAGSAPHPDFIIHEQSGDFLGSIGAEKVTVNEAAVEGGVHITDRKAEWLLLGTPSMRPRDAVSSALIYREDQVAGIYQAAHAKVHDEPGSQEGFRMDVTLGDHGAYPAELPEKG